MDSSENQSNKFLSSDAINDDFFIDVVERKLKTTRDKFKHKLVYIAPATGKNENYVSAVYRAKISVKMIETKEKIFVNVIIKALLQKSTLTNDLDVFKREILMYEDLIKSFEEIWRDATDEEANFGPKCLKVASDPYQIIVLDDLCSEGFEMVDKKVGLNLTQAKLVLGKLAKFHAASAIRFEKDGMVSDQLDRVSFLKSEMMSSSEQTQKTLASLGIFLKLLIETSSICGYPEIAEKISQWDITKLLLTYISPSEPMKCGFRVLNHGDSWSNNMMFKNDSEDNAIDMRYVDYQLSYWGSPSGDLGYFFISSLADDIKVEHFDDLLHFYHEELVKNLKVLNYKKHIPTLAELQIDMLEKGPSLSGCLVFILFFVKFYLNAELDLSMITDPEKVKIDVIQSGFETEVYRNALSTWLPFLNKRGFLDTLLPHAPNTPLMDAIMQQIQAKQQAEETDKVSK